MLAALISHASQPSRSGEARGGHPFAAQSWRVQGINSTQSRRGSLLQWHGRRISNWKPPSLGLQETCVALCRNESNRDTAWTASSIGQAVALDKLALMQVIQSVLTASLIRASPSPTYYLSNDFCRVERCRPAPLSSIIIIIEHFSHVCPEQKPGRQKAQHDIAVIRVPAST